MKKKTKIIIFIIVFIVILTMIGMIILLLQKNNNAKKQLDIKDWKDEYFYYLHNLVELNPIKIDNVGFLDSKVSDYPIMYVEEKRTDEKDNNLSLTFYYIKDNSVTHFGGFYSDDKYPKIEFLYNNDKKDYAYYIIEKVNDEESYCLLEKRLQSYAEYKNKDDFGQSCYYVNDDGIIELDNHSKKYKDEIFIDPNVEENFFNYINDKEKFRKRLENYKKQKEFITAQVKILIEDSIKKIEENHKPIQDEKQPSASSPNTTNKINIKVGEYAMQYGKYRACFNASVCRELILKQDGTAILDGKTMYFRVDSYDFAQGVVESQTGKNIYPAIILSNEKNGGGINVYTPYLATPDCIMSDGELECVNYIGE